MEMVLLGMRKVTHHIDLLETAGWYIADACKDRAAGVCALPSDMLRFSQSRGVQEANVCGNFPKKNSSP